MSQSGYVHINVDRILHETDAAFRIRLEPQHLHDSILEWHQRYPRVHWFLLPDRGTAEVTSPPFASWDRGGWALINATPRRQCYAALLAVGG